MKRTAIAPIAALLTACAAPHVHVPPHTGSIDGWSRWTEPPETMQLTWKRVGYFELQRVCGSGYSPLTVGGSGLGGGHRNASGFRLPHGQQP